MTQPNEQLIETIQRALDRWDSACEKGEAVSAGQFIEENCEEWLRALLEENKRMDDFCKKWIGEEDKFQDFGGWERIEEMKSQLEQAKEENKRLKLVADAKFLSLNKGDEEDRYALQEEVIRMTQELQQVKAERDTQWRENDRSNHEVKRLTSLRDSWRTERDLYKEANESLHTELAAKDKVLQWLVKNLLSGYEAKPVRDVLASYPPREKGATECN